MSKVNQIEIAIRELEGGKFQKLCDSFITAKENVEITSTGSHVGTDKTIKGTPDSYFINENGQFVFIEYTTTQKKGLLNKILDDIDKCFDISKTKIPKEKIDKIIYCHIDKIEANEKNKIIKLCQKNNCAFVNYDVSSLSFELAHSFPQVANDILNISTDTQQILLPKKFIEEKSRTITLENRFYHREDEKKKIKTYLDTNDLIVITGDAGVGKTRIALEVINEYLKENPNYFGCCIENRYATLEDDFLNLYHSHDNILLLLDDSNRIAQLSMILSFINQKPQKLKLILTVRNYAINTVLNTIPDKIFKTINIQKFNRTQIKEIVSDESIGVKNPLFINRICDISNGNIRLAIMASCVALDENKLSSLSNTINIYDSFFKDLNKFFFNNNNEKTKKVLGIISFFHIVDKNIPPSDLYTNFDINETDFWESIYELYNYEIVDLYENQICKINDQIIATYYFYKIVFDEKLVKMETLLTYYFPKYSERMREAIIPSANTFNFQKILDVLKTPVESQWNFLNKSEKYDTLYEFANTFYFAIPNKVLIYIKQIIDSIDGDSDKLIFETNQHGVTEKLYELLRKFASFDSDSIKISIQLACQYFLKCNSKAHDFYEYSVYSFGFSPDTVYFTTDLQKTFFNTLFEQAEKNDLLNEAIVYIAPQFLKMDSETSYTEGMQYTISFFELPFNSMIQELHEIVFVYLSKLSAERYIIFLEKYIRKMQPIRLKNTNEMKKALLYDSNFILPFIIRTFNFDELIYCIILNKYKDLLELFEVNNANLASIVEQANTNLYKVYLTLDIDRLERQELLSEEKSYQEIEENHKKKIASAITNYEINDYKILFENIEKEILRSPDQNNYSLISSVEKIIEILTKKKKLFFEVLEYIMIQDNRLNIRFYSVPSLFIHENPMDHLELYRLIKEKQYCNKHQWLYSFFSALQESQISEYYYNEFEAFLDSIIVNWNISFDCIIKFNSFKNGSFIKFMKLLYEKRMINNISFAILLNPYSDYRNSILSLFEDDESLFENIYLYEIWKNTYKDYDGFFIKHFLMKNTKFIIKYLETVYSKNILISDHISHSDLSCIWELENYYEIMDIATNYILSKEHYILDNCFLNVFFELKHPNNKSNIKKIEENQLNFINIFIENNYTNYEAINLIFKPIKKFFWEKMTDFAFAFLKKSNSIEAIQSISFDYEFYTGEETFLPVFNKMLSFWEELRFKLDDLEFIEIREFVIKKIDNWRGQISNEKKKQFIGHLYF